MTDFPEEAVAAATAAIDRELLSGKVYETAEDSNEALARAALEAAFPVLRERYAASLEAEGSPLCDCRHDGGSEPTSPRTGLPMAHHCECMTAKLAAMVLGPGVLTEHEKECGGEEPWIRRAA